MDDMLKVITPKSDQKNADDFLTGPMTIKITNVTVRPSTEQPVSVFFEGDDGKPWKPCKSMMRCLVHAWGPNSSKYVGRSLTLYCDPTVKWAGMAVGGIRVSHMSDIDAPLTMALTATKGSRKPYTVKPLTAASALPVAEPRQATDDGTADAATLITADEVKILSDRCVENGIDVAKLTKAAGFELPMIKAEHLARAHQWIDKQIDKMKGQL